MADSEQPTGGFLGRWSRRKQLDQSESEAAVADATTPVESSAAADETNIAVATDSAAMAARSGAIASGAISDDPAVQEVSAGEEILLTDEDMVPIESLNADSDYSPFFSEGVSKQLRNMALKKLFFSGKFAIRDGLDDYDDDFTKFEPLGDTITSDMKFHQRRKEQARLAKLEEERLEEERLKGEQEPQDKIADQQQDEEIQPVTDDEATPDSLQKVETDQDLPASEASDTAIARDILDDSNQVVTALQGGIKVIEACDDNIDPTTPHNKLPKLNNQSAQKAVAANQSQPSEETTRDQS